MNTNHRCSTSNPTYDQPFGLKASHLTQIPTQHPYKGSSTSPYHPWNKSHHKYPSHFLQICPVSHAVRQIISFWAFSVFSPDHSHGSTLSAKPHQPLYVGRRLQRP